MSDPYNSNSNKKKKGYDRYNKLIYKKERMRNLNKN